VSATEPSTSTSASVDFTADCHTFVERLVRRRERRPSVLPDERGSRPGREAFKPCAYGLEVLGRLLRQEARDNAHLLGLLRLIEHIQQHDRTTHLALVRQLVQCAGTLRIGDAGARQQRGEHRGNARELQQLRRVDAADEILDAGRVVRRERLADASAGFQYGWSLAERFAQDVVEVVVGWVLQRQQRDVGRFRRAEEAGGADGFEAHARVLVVRALGQQRQRVGHAVAPVAQHARGLRARARLGRLEHALQQFGIHHVVPLMQPQGLGHVVLVPWVTLVQLRDPRLQCRHHLGGVVLVQLDLRQLAREVLRLLEQIEQRRDGLAVDLRRVHERPAFVRDPIQPAVIVVAIGVADVVLHVADDRV
jgi:hypothetical protein